MSTFKPFDQEAGYFHVHNYVFDVCMPTLSNAGWRILCVTIRQTWGWIDRTDPTGRKEWDAISYSQFQEKSGLSSRNSISAGIQECLDAGYLVRRQVGHRQGTKKPIYSYALNRDFEVEVYDVSSTLTVPEDRGSSTESVPAASTESVPAASTESVLTKRNKGHPLKEKEEDLSSLWTPILDAVKLSMAEETFNAHLLNSRLLAASNGTWTVQVRSAYSVPLLENRLMPVLARTLQANHPDVTLRFVPKEAPNG